MEFILDFILGLSTGERVLYIGLIVYLVFRGVIKLPFVNISDRKIHSKSIDKALKVWDIKTRRTLYEQMNITEATHSAILFKMNIIYSKLTTNLEDTQHYDYLINDIEGKCKSIIRKWLKENHLTSKTDIEFELYIVEKIAFLLELVITELNKFYRDEFFDIPRKELQEANERNLIPYAKEKWRKMFVDCRDVSERKEQQIREIEGC